MRVARSSDSALLASPEGLLLKFGVSWSEFVSLLTIAIAGGAMLDSSTMFFVTTTFGQLTTLGTSGESTLSHELLLFATFPFVIFLDRSSDFAGVDNGLRYFFPVIGDVGIPEYAFNDVLLMSYSSVAGLTRFTEVSLFDVLPAFSMCFALRTGILLGLKVRSFSHACSEESASSGTGV